MEEAPAGGTDHALQPEGQLLGDGRHRPLRSVLGDPRGHPQRGRAEGATRIGAGERRPPPGDRGLEPGLHAVRPQGRRQPEGPACPARGHRHGLRAPVHGTAGETEQLRHRRLPAADPGPGQAVGAGVRPRSRLRGGRQGRHRHARVRRPPAGHRLRHRGRAAAGQHRGGLRDPPDPAACRALRLQLPGAGGALPERAGARAGGSAGWPVPRAEEAAGVDRERGAGGGEELPAHAGTRHQTPGAIDRRKRAEAPRRQGLRAVRHLRLPHRPHAADVPRAGGGGGHGRLRGRAEAAEGPQPRGHRRAGGRLDRAGRRGTGLHRVR